MTPSIRRFALVYAVTSLAIIAAAALLQMVFSYSLDPAGTAFVPLITASLNEGQRVTRARRFDPLPVPQVWRFARVAAVVSVGISCVFAGLSSVLPGGHELWPTMTPSLALTIAVVLVLLTALSIPLARLFYGLGVRGMLKTADKKGQR